MKIISTAVYNLFVCSACFSQSFDWHQDGYVDRSGGGKYLNIDSTGIDLQVSGLVNDGGYRGGLCTGIFNMAAGAEIHEYTFIFSEKVDLKFTISDINGGPGNCGFIDYLGFSGDPIFSASYGVTIVDDSLVMPYENGYVLVEYYSIDTLIIRHGEGVKCNPGFIIFSSFALNQNVKRLDYADAAGRDSLNIQNLLFDSDKSDITDNHRNQLDPLVKLLTENPGYKITICGHTDDVGNHAYNLNLSENRVQSVYEYLLSKGISSTRIQIVFYGETDPDDVNNTSEGRQKNRRVEIELFR
ncbi:MAG: OmpA family protein [Crocinitomicaceae bacterium]|nr:OmpA family protein [Crocinitomicaceae bacterium]